MSHIPDDYMFCCLHCEGALDYQYQDNLFAYYKCESCGRIRTDELPDELKRESFYLKTPDGNVAHVTGSPGLGNNPKTMEMLQMLIDVASKIPVDELDKINEAKNMNTNQPADDRYTYRKLKEALEKLTEKQLDSPVAIWDSMYEIFPSTLIVPTENWYQRENGTFAPASEFDEPEHGLGDAVFYKNCPILVDQHLDDFSEEGLLDQID